MTEDALQEARCLYESYIYRTGFTPPTTYADMLLFVELSGGSVYYHADAPDDFHGVQFDQWIIVAASARRSDREMMLQLAHEWCHWLRRREAGDYDIRLYEEMDEEEDRQNEEMIAIAFTRLF